MKRLILTTAIFMMLVVSGSMVLAQTEEDLVNAFLNNTNNPAMAEFYLDACPDILWLGTEPKAPKAGAKVKVRARIEVNADMSPYVTARAELIYTTDGIKFTSVSMKKAADGLWEAAIPAMKLGDFVRYYINAWDNGGNSVVQLPRRLGVDMSDDGIYTTAVTDPKDNSSRPGNDFLSLGYATDGYYLYFRIELAGKAAPPMSGGGIFFKGLGTHAQDLRYWDTYSGATLGLDAPAILYAPNPLMPRKGLYILNAILNDAKPIGEVKFVEKDNVLYGRVLIEDLTGIPEQGYPMYGIAAYINMAAKEMALDDGTHHTIVYFDGQGYEIK